MSIFVRCVYLKVIDKTFLYFIGKGLYYTFRTILGKKHIIEAI